MTLTLIATSAFGLEAVVKRELIALGYEPRTVRPGRIAFRGDAEALCRTNLWLRSADRVLVEMACFPCEDFDALFETTRAVPWHEWIGSDAAILVRGRSRKSQLESVPACQRTVKKAIVEQLLPSHGVVSLPETGPAAGVSVSVVDNIATVDLDASGEGLHRRNYRKLAAPAQLRETLAAALVQLSFWDGERPLIDPFCGTGTIVIEAAMIGRRMAPGRLRRFAGENYAAIPTSAWSNARDEAGDLAKPDLPERIIGWDADPEALKLARVHASLAEVAADIHLQQRDFTDLSSQRKYGCVVTNPPYGQRMGRDDEVEALYRSMPQVLRRLPTWSHFILSARGDLEGLVGQQADRRRKLYSGQLECTYYQFYGPKRRRRAATQSSAGDEAEVLRAPTVDVPAPIEREPPTTESARRPAFGGLKSEAVRQAEEFNNRLRKRARHLRRWPTKRGITCYRLYDRDVPDVPLAVDVYEDALHIAEYERPHDRTTAEHADWLDHMADTAAVALSVARELVFVKRRAPQRGDQQYERLGNQRALRVVREGGLKFQVNLSDYLDTGLFLDHRLTRDMVRKASEGASFLNLFAYTGTFTTYAAAGGAAQSTSVDLSGNYLEWAGENLQLNGLAAPQHRLVQSDARDYLASLRGRPQFDVAVVDPPTFSNSKRADDWDVQRDHADLLCRLFARMRSGGVVYFATNSRRFKLDEQAMSGVDWREISRQTVPEDFRNQRIHRCWRIVVP